jgi:hypothetical protein
VVAEALDRVTRVAADLVDSAAAEGARQRRSAKQQLEHWGKSTLIAFMLPPLLPASVVVNADEIARQRWSKDPAPHAYGGTRSGCRRMADSRLDKYDGTELGT